MTAQQRKPRADERSFGDAARNFQEAAEQLAASAAGEASQRAATFLDEAAARLRREAGGAGQGGPSAQAGAEREPRQARRERRRSRHRYRYEYRYEYTPRPEAGSAGEGAASDPAGGEGRHRRDYGPIRRVRRLYLNPERRRIVGVCAGIADYFGVEPWVTRCAALTALIFVPGVTFPAYWVAFVVMDRPPGSRGAKRRLARRRRAQANAEDAEEAVADAPEPSPSPRRRLRDLLEEAGELELRLQRMETHITSGQYELRRELRGMEDN